MVEWGKQTFFISPASQIHNFLDSFRYRKSANFLGVLVRKLQILIFVLLSENSKYENFYKIKHNSV